MASTMKGAAYLLNAIVGQNDENKYTSANPFAANNMPDYVKACRMSGSEGKRIGTLSTLISFGDDGVPDEAEKYTMAAFNLSLAVIRSAGAVIIDDVPLSEGKPCLEENCMRATPQADFMTNLPIYLSQWTTNTNLHDIRAFIRPYQPEHWADRDALCFDGTLDLGRENTSPGSICPATPAS